MLHIRVGGDAVEGWQIEVHSGDHFGCYSPAVETAAEAEADALKEHEAAFGLTLDPASAVVEMVPKAQLRQHAE